MTAENNGTGSPEGDDPFAYLYRQEGGGADGAPAPQQPGVPRRSYNQVRAVGERQYGGQQAAPQATAAFPHQQGAPGAPGGPSAHYAAPETMPGGRAAARQQNGHGSHGGGRGGGSRNGLLIGAVAVLAAVVIGIAAAIAFNGGDEGGQKAGDSPSASADADEGKDPGRQNGGGDGEGDKADDGGGKLPKEDAAALRLGGGTVIARDVPGAKGKDGAYVAGINKPGASAKWSTTVPEAGTYNLYVRYAVPGKDMHLSLAVNGKPHATGLGMKNYSNAEEGDWEKWTYTYATVNVDKGSNSFLISCGEGDKCDVNLDQVWLEEPKES